MAITLETVVEVVVEVAEAAVDQTADPATEQIAEEAASETAEEATEPPVGAPAEVSASDDEVIDASFEVVHDQSDLLSQISNAELRCKKAEYRVMEKKEELKAAKDEFDGCVSELRSLCAQ